MASRDVDEFWSGVATEAPDPIEPPRRRPRGGWFVTLLMLLLLAPALALTALRISGQDGNRYTAAALSLVPYATVYAAVLVLVALPRATADRRPYTLGSTVRVLSVNLHLGQADSARVVDLVRRYHIDLLSLQELTPGVVATLEAAGLRSALPNVQFEAEPGASGSGLASRFPLTPRSLVSGPTTLDMPSALVDLPGPKDLEVVAVHPVPPVDAGGPERWQRELASLPAPDVRQPARLLAGDFNATLDHGALRAMLNFGYVDAGDQVGRGLEPTWPANRRYLPPLVTLDHLLVDSRCPVDDYGVLDVPGTDHRAVWAQFVVPDPTAVAGVLPRN